MTASDDISARVRLDKWLWAARFYKTRSLCAQEIDKGRIKVNGAQAKPAKEVRVGDQLEIRQGALVRTVNVQAISGVRGPAALAARLYAETPESISQRKAAAERQRLAPEPAQGLAQGRPSKRERRTLDQWQQGHSSWGDRWSASLEDE